MDAAAHYRQLLQLGRDEFLAAAAPAALVRYVGTYQDNLQSGVITLSIDREIEQTMPGRDNPAPSMFQLFPLTKKPGASFPDRITVGRTSNNDIVIGDTSVSRLHAYVRRDGNHWVVADAGSKNGSWLTGKALVPRKELPLSSPAELRLGDVDLTFYLAADLFDALSGT